MIREPGSPEYQAMVERSNWRGEPRRSSENVGEPTMKVTVEERLSAFEPRLAIRTGPVSAIRMSDNDSNLLLQFE
jgi:hypothetical protein